MTFYFAKLHGVYVERIEKDAIHIAHRSGLSWETRLELQRYYNLPIVLHPVDEADFSAGLSMRYEGKTETTLAAMVELEEHADLQELMRALPVTEDLLESEADAAPVIKLLNAVLAEAIQKKASDVHVETFEEKLVIRFRLDGLLQEIVEPPRALAPLLISRLKVMAKLDLSEKRLPQDGRIALRIAGRAIDIRVSTIPTHYGERLVLRLLDKHNAPLDLNRLGLCTYQIETLHEWIARPNGMILIAGPTGSGKTTTLYAILNELNIVTRNVLTIEDPIEYYLPGIGQTQVNTKVDMTFARGLRAILRQDPDIVMVGEMRDAETAEIAVRASLTGHLVLSTVHTNTAVGTLTRLRDMGIESFLLSSTLLGVVAQRLVRVLCEACKAPAVLTEKIKSFIAWTSSEESLLYRAVGCEACHGTGYRGRLGIYEIMKVDATLREMIQDQSSAARIELAVRAQSPSLRECGWQRVREGLTTVEEVLRVTSEDF